MDNDTNFAVGLRMGYILSGYVSNYIESTCNDDLKTSQKGTLVRFNEISNFIKSFSEFLRSYGKD